MIALVRLWLSHLLAGRNQFASGGLLLMIVGSVGVFVRSLPGQVWEWFVEQTTMMITVQNDDPAFQWVKEWFLEQEFLKRIRKLDVDTSLRGAEIALVPAPGRHRFWYAGRPFWVWFHRKDEATHQTRRRVESLTFRTVGRDQAVLKRFIRDIVACNHSKEEKTSSLYVFDDYWLCVQAYSPRLLDSVILKPGEKEHLVEDVQRFRQSRARYQQLGVPFHRGYLLHGPPGTGKTSLVSGLAARFDLSIYVVNLTEFNDRSLKSAMNDVPENSVILFEDIDCMKAGHRREVAGIDEGSDTIKAVQSQSAHAGQGVTLSGLLNVLDGLHAPENVIFVMTTNHAETLDPALLRPGRIDYKLFLGEAASSQRVELYKRFFPGCSEADAAGFADAHSAATMAEFQGLLLGMEEGLDLMLR